MAFLKQWINLFIAQILLLVMRRQVGKLKQLLLSVHLNHRSSDERGTSSVLFYLIVTSFNQLSSPFFLETYKISLTFRQ